ncbi:hypothetical protein ACV07N_00005, partial [Roseivirga echinicomitans]
MGFSLKASDFSKAFVVGVAAPRLRSEPTTYIFRFVVGAGNKKASDFSKAFVVGVAAPRLRSEPTTY